MSFDCDIQYEIEGDLPTEAQLTQWVETALSKQRDEGEVCIRIVSPEESRTLNRTFRNQDKPTNVLSFPFDVPDGIPLHLLGDLIICADIVKTEADAQNKALYDHWAHMVVHGCLHLIGFDHINDAEAKEMEDLEKKFLPA